MDVVGGGNSSISVLKLPWALPRVPGRETRLETAWEEPGRHGLASGRGSGVLRQMNWSKD